MFLGPLVILVTRLIRLATVPSALILMFFVTSSLAPVSGQRVQEMQISSAVSPAVSGQGLRFKHLTTVDGLPSNRVLSVVQDSRGFMWFATFDGLARYDGYEFEIFRHVPGDEHSLSANLLIRLLLDSDGHLWVGTLGGGLNRFNPKTEQFTHYRNDPTEPHSLSSDNVMDLYQDREGTLWIGTDGGGLNRYDPDIDGFINYQNDPKDPDSLSHQIVWAILEGGDGTLWVGTDGGGLNRFDRETEKFSVYRHDPGNPTSLSDDSVLALSESKDGSIWVGTRSNGLDRFNPDEETFTHYQHEPDDPYSLGSNDIMDLNAEQSGKLWIGTAGGGLNQLDVQTGRFFRYEANLDDPSNPNSNWIRDIYIDSTGLLWLGSVGGGVSIAELEPKSFTNFKYSPGDPSSLSDNNVLEIFEDKDGRLWIGTGSGLDHLDRETDQISRFRHDPNDPNSLSDNFVRSIDEDDDGFLWLGTRTGLNRFDPETGMFATYHPNSAKPFGLLSESVFSVEFDSDDTLWVGTGLGLNRLDPSLNHFQTYLHNADDPESLGGNNITVLRADRTGRLWVGLRGDGINVFDRETQRFTRFPHNPDDPTSLGGDTVWSILEDTAGNIWIGTSNGLDLFDPVASAFIHFGEEIGLPRGGVMGILEDKHPPEQGGPNLWISTSTGLYKINPQTESLRRYSLADGIQGDDFNWGSAYKTSTGELYFGGNNGMTAFNPSQIQDNPYVPPVVLTDFQLANESVQIGEDSVLEQSITETDNLSLSYQDRVISFEFSALDFHAPDQNRYRYMMEGFDDDWIEVGSERRFVTYTNLDPGAYIFRVLGSNNDGIWNEEGTSLGITITPPWWQTTWFTGLAVVVAVAGLFGAYRWRVRSLENRSRELETQITEKTLELDGRVQELNTLLSVSQEVTSTLDLEPTLNLILDYLRQVVEYDVATIRRLVQENMELRAERWLFPKKGRPSPSLSVADIPIVREMLETQQARLVGDHQFNTEIVGDDELFNSDLTGDVLQASRTLMCVPLIVKGETIGMLVLGHHQPNYWVEKDKELVQTFANQAAISISNAELFEKAAESAALEERTQLAHNLHDSATQSLYSASLFSETGKELAEKGELDSALHYLSRIGEEVRQALKDLRLLVFQLRPPLLEEAGLAGAIQKRLDAVENRAGMEARLVSETLPPLRDEVSEGLYAIVSESLNNVLKHAEAGSVTVSLLTREGRLTLEVIDDGKGFNLDTARNSGGMGLESMQERATRMGGDLIIQSALDKGSRVKVTVQLSEASATIPTQAEISE